MFRIGIVLFLLGLPGPQASADTLVEYARQHPLKLFTATRGSVMPNSIDQTNNLQEGDKALLLSGKGLTDIAGISKLTVEDGGKRQSIRSVKNIPDEIGMLENVIFLYYNHNRLRELPPSLADMDSLVGMYFTGNQFTEVPPFVFGMTRLKKLQFSENRIAVLPAEIGNLTELRHFNMAGNEIAVLPESVAKLTRLRVCDFSDNRLTSLPEAFGQVRIVNQLRVRNNPLTTLPAGFAEMRATIDVTGTKIDVASLPPGLRAKISTEKPPGSKEEDKIIVRPPVKPKQGKPSERRNQASILARLINQIGERASGDDPPLIRRTRSRALAERGILRAGGNDGLPSSTVNAACPAPGMTHSSRELARGA